MEIKIQAVRFEATEKLKEFINKKVSKLSRFDDKIGRVDVSLKVVKPESANNKDVLLALSTSGKELIAQETCDTFEEAIDKAVDSLTRQLTKHKEKSLGR